MTVNSAKQETKISPRARICPVGMDLAALGKRWTFHILRNIGIEHIDRFTQILKAIPGLTPRVLIMRLNELEQCSLIKPITIQEKPRLVRWVLTHKGNDALPIIKGYSSYLGKWYPNASIWNHVSQPIKYPTIQELAQVSK